MDRKELLDALEEIEDRLNLSANEEVELLYTEMMDAVKSLKGLVAKRAL